MKKKVLFSIVGIAIFFIGVAFNSHVEEKKEIDVKKVEAKAYTPPEKIKADIWRCEYRDGHTICHNDGSRSCLFDC